MLGPSGNLLTANLFFERGRGSGRGEIKKESYSGNFRWLLGLGYMD
jgi:hypothetical protein